MEEIVQIDIGCHFLNALHQQSSVKSRQLLLARLFIYVVRILKEPVQLTFVINDVMLEILPASQTTGEKVSVNRGAEDLAGIIQLKEWRSKLLKLFRIALA